MDQFIIKKKKRNSALSNFSKNIEPKHFVNNLILNVNYNLIIHQILNANIAQSK